MHSRASRNWVKVSPLGPREVTNRSYESWFGKPAAEILDHPVREVLGEEAYGYRAAFFDRAFAGEHLAFDAPLPYRDGQWRQAQIEYIPRRRTDGSIDGVFVFAVDIESASAPRRRWPRATRASAPSPIPSSR